MIRSGIGAWPGRKLRRKTVSIRRPQARELTSRKIHSGARSLGHAEGRKF
jgi:hypothetical protein